MIALPRHAALHVCHGFRVDISRKVARPEFIRQKIAP
jgi:hypothetical protein